MQSGDRAIGVPVPGFSFPEISYTLKYTRHKWSGVNLPFIFNMSGEKEGAKETRSRPSPFFQRLSGDHSRQDAPEIN